MAPAHSKPDMHMAMADWGLASRLTCKENFSSKCAAKYLLLLLLLVVLSPGSPETDCLLLLIAATVGVGVA